MAGRRVPPKISSSELIRNPFKLQDAVVFPLIPRTSMLQVHIYTSFLRCTPSLSRLFVEEGRFSDDPSDAVRVFGPTMRSGA